MQFSTEGAHERPRQVESETGGCGPCLEWAEKMFWMGHPAPVVNEFHEDLVAAIFRSDGKNSITVLGERSDTVGNQVQKHLHEAWPVSPHKRQAGLHGPMCHDIFLLQ